MKKNIYRIAGSALFAMAAFGFALCANAWTGPTGTPPAGNVAAPLNVSSSAQIKAGAIGVGDTTAPSYLGVSSGSMLDVNGATSTNGLGNFGTSVLVQHVTIGTAPCYTCVSGSGGSSGVSGGALSGSRAVPSIAEAPVASFISGIVKSVSNAIAGTFQATPAVASTSSGSGGCTSVGASCGAGGICLYGSFSGLGCVFTAGPGGYCDSSDNLGYDRCAGSYCSMSPDTGGVNVCVAPSSGGGTDPYIGGATSFAGTVVAADPPTVSFNPTTATISTGASDSITYSVSYAASCVVSSTNASNNWNSSISVSTTGAASGTHSLGAFSTPGSYSYYLNCTSPAGLTASATATITAGPSYILDVYGNSDLHGYVTADGNIYAGGFIESGIPVCLKNGTNCPTYSSISGTGTANYLTKFTGTSSVANSSVKDLGNGIGVGNSQFDTDQGGSLELGGNNSTANSSGAVPYIDFHYGTGSAQDYNVRLINDANGVLDVDGTLKQNGTSVCLQNGTNCPPSLPTPPSGQYSMLVSNPSGTVSWVAARAVYNAGHDSSGCDGTDNDVTNNMNPTTMNTDTCGNHNSEIGAIAKIYPVSGHTNVP